MSATAFQRMRREAAAKKAAQSQKEVEETPDIQLSEVEEENTEDEDKEEKTFKDMTVDELKEYAEKNNVDIGKATSKSGILEKIQSVEKAE